MNAQFWVRQVFKTMFWWATIPLSLFLIIIPAPYVVLVAWANDYGQRPFMFHVRREYNLLFRITRSLLFARRS